MFLADPVSPSQKSILAHYSVTFSKGTQKDANIIILPLLFHKKQQKLCGVSFFYYFCAHTAQVSAAHVKTILSFAEDLHARCCTLWQRINM